MLFNRCIIGIRPFLGTNRIPRHRHVHLKCSRAGKTPRNVRLRLLWFCRQTTRQVTTIHTELVILWHSVNYSNHKQFNHPPGYTIFHRTWQVRFIATSLQSAIYTFHTPPGYPKLLGDGNTINDPQTRSAEERTGTANDKQTLHTISITYLKVRDFRLRAFLCIPLFVLNFALQKRKLQT